MALTLNSKHPSEGLENPTPFYKLRKWLKIPPPWMGGGRGRVAIFGDKGFKVDTMPPPPWPSPIEGEGIKPGPISLPQIIEISDLRA